VLHFVRLLDLPTNIILSSKGLPGTNTPAYNEHSYIKDVKCLKIGPRFHSEILKPNIGVSTIEIDRREGG
jgi:hypothetical protein